MISTIEAIYCAAWEVQNAKLLEEKTKQNVTCIAPIQQRLTNIDIHNTNLDQSLQQDDLLQQTSSLLHLFFIFGLQRALIQKAATNEGRSMPFSEQGKNEQRALRKYAGTEKQARDKQIGQKLKEKRRQEKLSMMIESNYRVALEISNKTIFNKTLR